MLIKTIQNQIDEINKSKEEMVSTNIEILKMSVSLSEGELDAINKQLESEDLKESEKETLLKRKDEIMDEIDRLTENVEKENKELDQITEDIGFKESKYDNVYDLLEDLGDLINQYDQNPSSDKDKKAKYIKAKGIIEDTINFKRLDTDKKYHLSKKYLKENYNKASKELQNKISNDNKYVYPSCFQVKNNIEKIIKAEKPELTDKEVSSMGKLYSSYLLHHLNRINLKEEGIYVYYMLTNLYKIDELPIDKHLEYKKSFIQAFDKLF